MAELFRTFITGLEAGQAQRQGRTHRAALDEANRLYAAGDYQGAERAALAVDPQTAAQYGAMGERSQTRQTQQSVAAAMAGLGPNATPRARTEAGAAVALKDGNLDFWSQLRDRAGQMRTEERDEQRQRMEMVARIAQTVLPGVPLAERQERAVQEAIRSGADEKEARQAVANLDFSDENLPRMGQLSMDAAQIYGETRRQTESDRAFGLQERQVGIQAGQLQLQRQTAERQAVMQQQLFSSEAVDYAAAQYRQTGRMPSLGAGQTGAAMRQRILSRAAQLASADGSTAEADVIQQRALSANSTALATLTRQMTMVHNFEQTALANLELAVEASEQTPRTGSPIINNIMMEAQRRGGGDPQVQRLVIAIETFAEEYAKVMSGATGAAAATDDSRRQAHRMISADMTIPQIRVVAGQMRAEMANRITSLREEQRSLTEAMATPWAEASRTAHPPPTPDATQPQTPEAPAQAGARGGQANATAPNIGALSRGVQAFDLGANTPERRAAFEREMGITIEEARRLAPPPAPSLREYGLRRG